MAVVAQSCADRENLDAVRRLSALNYSKYDYGRGTESSELINQFPGVYTREAAVLILLFSHEGQIRVVLTLRSESVTRNKGEVSFAGGIREPLDHGPVETALREAYEEIGVPPSSVEVICKLVPVVTRHRFLLFPVIALMPDKFDYKPSCNEEVVACFNLPLERFLDPTGYHKVDYKFPSGIIYPLMYFEDNIPQVSEPVRTYGLTAWLCVVTSMLAYGRRPNYELETWFTVDDLFDTYSQRADAELLLELTALKEYRAKKMDHSPAKVSQKKPDTNTEGENSSKL